MLGKLLKYELKASSRTLLPLYIGTLIVAVLCSIQTILLMDGIDQGLRFYPQNEDNLLVIFTFLLFFALCVAIVVLTLMTIIQRFSKNLIGDEGYLMFTLPVTHAQLLNSKLLAALLWIVGGTVIMAISAVIIWTPGLVVMMADVDWASFWNEIQYMLSQWNPLLMGTLVTVDGFVSMIAFILTVYLAIMLGQMEQLSKHRVAVSVVLFFLIKWVFGLLSSLVMELAHLENFYTVLESNDQIVQALYVIFGVDVVLTLVQCVICFAGVIWLMQKKLNL